MINYAGKEENEGVNAEVTDSEIVRVNPADLIIVTASFGSRCILSLHEMNLIALVQ